MSTDSGWAIHARWVVVEGKAHRPDPARSHTAMCGHAFDPADAILRKPPRNVLFCLVCHNLVRLARQQMEARSGSGSYVVDAPSAGTGSSAGIDYQATEDADRRRARSLRAALAAERRIREKRRAADAADRQARSAERGNSVRTVGGGLPTLGKHHR